MLICYLFHNPIEAYSWETQWMIMGHEVGNSSTQHGIGDVVRNLLLLGRFEEDSAFMKSSAFIVISVSTGWRRMKSSACLFMEHRSSEFYYT
jgi:hypothetical protein